MVFWIVSQMVKSRPSGRISGNGYTPSFSRSPAAS